MSYGVSPPSLPHPLFPKFQFWAPADDVMLHITVLLRYRQDEQFIEIVGIGAVEYDELDDEQIS